MSLSMCSSCILFEEHVSSVEYGYFGIVLDECILVQWSSVLGWISTHGVGQCCMDASLNMLTIY
jgi:hypothetical protein